MFDNFDILFMSWKLLGIVLQGPVYYMTHVILGKFIKKKYQLF